MSEQSLRLGLVWPMSTKQMGAGYGVRARWSVPPGRWKSPPWNRSLGAEM